MKKAIAILLSALLIAALVLTIGCKKPEEPAPTAPQEAPATPPPAPADANAPAADANAAAPADHK